MTFEAIQTLRDVLRQIAVFDACPRLRGAAGKCLEQHSTANLVSVLGKATGSPYRPKLQAAYDSLGGAA